MTAAGAGSGLVALDVDGTVVDYFGERLSPAALAVLDVEAAGWHIVLATGRTGWRRWPRRSALAPATWSHRTGRSR